MPFHGLAARLGEVRECVAAAAARGGHGQRVQVVAVTKTYGPEAVIAAWEAGVKCVGENRVQEALDKMDHVAVPVEWHLIGHLQRNKARQAWRFALVHSVDSGRLADTLSTEGLARGTPLRVLVQVNATGEASKGGFPLADLPREAERLLTLGGLRFEGVMTMAPLDADERMLRGAFGGARHARDVMAAAGHPATELSMGMSGDYEIAVEEGATMIRLGTILFGARA